MKSSYLRRVCTLVAVLVAPGCGGPTEEDVQGMAVAIEALRPHMERIAALHTALPAQSSARELPLTTTIPQESLETVDLAHLEAVLGLPARADSAPRQLLIGEAFQGQHVRYLEPDPEPSFGSIRNVESRVNALAKVKHVAVFLPTLVDKGEVKDAINDKGSYIIERAAHWKGWVFTYAFEDPPRLVAAFPMEARSRDQMTLMVTQGYRPNADALIDDAVFALKRETVARLTEAR